MLSGGRWKDGFFVADLEDLALQDLAYYAKATLKGTRVQTVREIVGWDPKANTIDFPLYPRYHEANMTIYGIRNSRAVFNEQTKKDPHQGAK